MDQIEYVARLLEGRDMISGVISVSENRFLKANNLVVVFGLANDTIEFCGAIDEEVHCYCSCDLYVDHYGVFVDPIGLALTGGPNNKERMPNAQVIHAVWDESEDVKWSFSTTIPNKPFLLLDSDLLGGPRKPFCQGLVFSVDNLR